MKIALSKERVVFYAWTSLAFYVVMLLNTLATTTDHLTTAPTNFLARAVNNLWFILYVATLNFIFFEYSTRYIRRNWKKVLLPLLLLWAHVMLWSYGLYGWRSLGIALQFYTPLKQYKSTGQAVESQMAYSTGSVFFFGIVRHVYSYIKLRQAAQQLRIEKQEAELNYLRSQTNPHFLFNTLNNIYALTREKSDLAPESILRLSKILRYLLYETSGNYVAVDQELKIITDYLALEKLRYDESLRVGFNYDVEDMKQALPPLLLMPLVENAFKHGVSETRNQPFVDIHLSIRQRQLTFTVKNSTDTGVADRPVKENIGLANLRRQLELLFTDYRLSVQQAPAVFTASLQINLASHV